MTAQMHDLFLFQEKNFSIAEVNGGGLFQPASHGMQPMPSITSCWRGYVCTYAAPYNKLQLHTLQVNLGQEGPEIHNIRPVFSRDRFDNVYHDIHLPIDFTGSIRIATGFIQELYVHMGFAPAWKYESVFELSIAQGDVLDTKDISQPMAALREKMIRQPLQPGPNASAQEVEDWIASTFMRNYKE